MAPGWTTASFSAAIASRVSPSTLACARGRRSSAPTTGDAGRSSRRGARRGPPRRPPRRRAGPRTRRTPPRSASRTGSRPVARPRPRTRSIAASKSASSPTTLIRSGPPGDVRRVVGAGPQPFASRASPRSSARSSTCRSCRRRGLPRTPCSGCRAPRAARAFAPFRSRREATGRATRSRHVARPECTNTTRAFERGPWAGRSPHGSAGDDRPAWGSNVWPTCPAQA